MHNLTFTQPPLPNLFKDERLEGDELALREQLRYICRHDEEILGMKNYERKVARLDRAREMERKRRMLTKKQGKLTGPQPPEQENFYDFFVIKIQALVRGYLCRCWLRFRKEMSTPSSIQIQRIVRGKLARRRVYLIRQRLNAVIELQRVFRGYRARLRAKAALQDKHQHLAAIEIQRVWRGKMAKIRVQVMSYGR